MSAAQNAACAPTTPAASSPTSRRSIAATAFSSVSAWVNPPSRRSPARSAKSSRSAIPQQAGPSTPSAQSSTLFPTATRRATAPSPTGASAPGPGQAWPLPPICCSPARSGAQGIALRGPKRPRMPPMCSGPPRHSLARPPRGAPALGPARKSRSRAPLARRPPDELRVAARIALRGSGRWQRAARVSRTSLALPAPPAPAPPPDSPPSPSVVEPRRDRLRLILGLQRCQRLHRRRTHVRIRVVEPRRDQRYESGR